MKTVRKFESFEELKSSEKKTLNQAESLKKHKEFERVIKDFKSVKVPKSLIFPPNNVI